MYNTIYSWIRTLPADGMRIQPLLTIRAGWRRGRDFLERFSPVQLWGLWLLALALLVWLFFRE